MAQNSIPRWDSYLGRALALHYAARNDPNGLTDFDVIERAAPLGGLGDVSTQHKRVSELRTEYDPPLIAPVTESLGKNIARPGRYAKSPRVAWRITDEGKAMFRRMERD
jgi:hypothetical protein